MCYSGSTLHEMKAVRLAQRVAGGSMVSAPDTANWDNIV